MSINKKSIIITVVLIFILFVVGVIYKSIKDYNSKLYLVSEKRIVYAAKKCIYEEVCTGNKITLKDLYSNEYLKKEINPVTKEVYSENSYVDVDNNYKFVILD